MRTPTAAARVLVCGGQLADHMPAGHHRNCEHHKVAVRLLCSNCVHGLLYGTFGMLTLRWPCSPWVALAPIPLASPGPHASLKVALATTVCRVPLSCDREASP